jgi:hypothetical protein
MSKILFIPKQGLVNLRRTSKESAVAKRRQGTILHLGGFREGLTTPRRRKNKH